ncbi:alanine--tRNA ligase [Candidatus Contendibacter odensensis]|uniref:Alanine--tRNA ligase n=1 Tax=Candidatus Contendobacter odensis Run_B_J11 TaxID=1400861 RepID=A0A7U7J5Q4_9GAMM|nr:alanine--tRNA ligase [Candidatus Contendobacter odensis]CDH47636.1 alanyl-tRNA synthetase [Candidatus Contendobacter odensis Run_B_J11]
MINSAELRKLFLDYFHDHGHEVVASSSLVPINDSTLLFTNAGMVQFKDVFTGRDQRPYLRAASSQRCVRAGGKHNDLENVGYTARHHTFFEMLGNFSFGDYFKADAIRFAWEFLTGVLKLPPDKLWVTVYLTDDEAYQVWADEIKVPRERITRIGDKPGGKRYESDNFWAMGDTGPCGPCSEIFYDHGPEIAGGPPGTPDEDGDRYIEIWNLVFMQYDRSADGTLIPLPKPSVDTGMGLERLAAVMQGVHSNYEIDLFHHLIQATAEATGAADLQSSSLRVIADHIRATAFLITDGVLPSNEGRGYVLRRIMRRAIRHGYKLGAEGSFFHTLVAPLAAEMGDAYPELVAAADQVTRVIRQEEERFAETLAHGMKLLEDGIAGLSSATIPGATVFKLYDTYGFPVDLTADIARERGLQLDMEGFDREMAAQRERARAASKFYVELTDTVLFSDELEGEVTSATDFQGYDHIQVDNALILNIYLDGKSVDCLSVGQQGMVVLKQTPFYAESGGQVGDQGVLDKGDGTIFEVSTTIKYRHNMYSHVGILRSGKLCVSDTVVATVDAAKRQATALHHSATHLLHAALRRVLGTHVSQKGSLVDPQRLRFDFAHFEPISAEQLEAIERLVNAQIRGNVAVETEIMDAESAMASGAMALFGEKYGDKVRVLRMGDFSTELCGGTHVHRVGDIGLFKIISEGGVAAGVRRIEAVTGDRALDYVASLQDHARQVAQLVKGDRDSFPDKVRQLVERTRQLEKEIEQLKGRLASGQGADVLSQTVEVNGIKVLAARLDGVDVKTLREAVDRCKEQLKTAAVVLATVEEGKVRLVAGVTAAETTRIKAGELVNMVAQQVGGKGGGRPDLAQAGGTDPTQLDAALRSVPEWIHRQLA